MRLRSVSMLFFAWLGAAPALARWDDSDAGKPPVEVHSLGQFGAYSGCAIVEDARGRLYVTNDQVAEYDGSRWSAIPVGKGSDVLCLSIDEHNRIWCGTSNDLGYIGEDTTGARAFHSLRGFLPPDTGLFLVYGVHHRHGRTLFVLEASLLVWDGIRFEAHALPVPTRLNSFDFEGATYVSQKGAALWRWDGASLSAVDLSGHESRIFFGAWRGADGDPVFVSSEFLVRVRPEGAEAFAHETMREIRPSGVTSTARLPDGSVALSTELGGVFILGDDGRILRHLDRGDGLPGLNCPRVITDSSRRLWLGLQSHVVGLDSRNVQTRFDASNGNGGDAVGVVHSAETGTLSATMEGLRRLVPGVRTSASFQPAPYDSGILRELATLPDGTIIAAGSRVLQCLSGNRAGTRVASESMIYSFAPLHPQRPHFAIGEGSLVTFIDLEQSEPRLGSIGDFPEYPTRLAGDGAGRLWASLRRSGVIAIERAGQPDSTRRHFQPGVELPTPFHDPAVFVLGGQAFAFASNAIVALPAIPGEAPRLIHPGTGLLAAERSGAGQVWVVAARAGREARLARISKSADGETTLHITDQIIRGIGSITELSRTQEHILWIGGSEGSIRIDSREVADEPAPRAPILQAVGWRTGEDITRLSLATPSTVAFHRTGTIEFELRDGGDPFASTQLIETRLAGAGHDWRLTGKSRPIAGLDEGRYTLEARVVSFLGDPGPVVRYTFTIRPPWFRTPLAYLGYVLAFGSSLTLAVQWRTRRIRRQNAQLEQLVNRRTEELAQAVSARSSFLANMGHEIRNPLNGVVGLVDTLRARALAEEEKGIVNRIGACADQLISVIDDVLEYARIDAGRIALRNRAFAVREPVEAAIDILRAARPEAVIELQGADADLDSHVIGDPDRIRHILVNYLSNALKFGGGTPVQVALRRDGPLLVFSVTDHGPGISPEEQARLFVRFSRGSQAYRHDIPGTGLGLAACRAYAGAMGGDVSVESEPGQGATFFLRLPFQPAEHGAVAGGVVSAPDLMVGKRALIVDDQDFNRLVLADLLGRMGATTDQASTIGEARAAFAARPADIVFVDFDLAGATGADLATWIRQEAPAGRDVPVVATTAFEVDEVRRRCDEAGMDGFLAKPVTARRLAEVVARIECIRSGGTAPAAPAAHEPPGPSGFLDILAGGDPDKRRGIERSTWRDVLTEALTAHRALRRADAPLAARHAHRLVSAALILGEREIVTAARELNAFAKAGDLAGARMGAARLRERIRRARRPRAQ